MFVLWHGPFLLAQQAKVSTPPRTTPSPEKSLTLAEQGHCHETIAGLKQTMNGQFPASTRKQAGVLGIRCSLAVDDRDSAIDFIRLLNRQLLSTPTYFLSSSTPTPIYPRERRRISAVPLRNPLPLIN